MTTEEMTMKEFKQHNHKMREANAKYAAKE